jgi:hypothetical protein
MNASYIVVRVDGASAFAGPTADTAEKTARVPRALQSGGYARPSPTESDPIGPNRT